MIDKQQTSDYKTELEKQGTIIFVPKGISMWPTLKNKKQSVIIEKKSDKRLSEGDVAFFKRSNGDSVLHRVTCVLDNGYNFMGDSCLTEEFVLEQDVFGVMKGFYKGKKLVMATDKKYIQKYTKWLSNEKRRRRVLKRFYLRIAIKQKLKKIFKVRGKKCST